MKVPNEIDASFGRRLRLLRQAAGLSQAALGRSVGISFQQIQKYEAGKDRIAVSMLQKLAACLGVHPGSFFDTEVPISIVAALRSVRTKREPAYDLRKVRDDGVRRRLSALIEALSEPVKE